MILVISRFRVKNNMEGAVAQAFAQRPGLVDLQPGFLGMEVFTDAQDPATFNLVTRWTDEASFRAWHHSDAHKESHRGIPKGLKLDGAQTQLFVMNAIASASPVEGLEREVVDAAPFVAEFLRRSRNTYYVAASAGGMIHALNIACANLLRIDRTDSAEVLRHRVESGRRLPGERFGLELRDPTGGAQRLECQIDLRPDGFVLIAECPANEDSKHFDELAAINNDLASVMRESVRKERELAHALAELEVKNTQLEQANQRITELARTDTLTGVFNRRHFDEMFTSEVRRARRLNTALTVMMIDLDHFKSINDRYGHAVGDAVLAVVGPALQSSSRSHDVVARYGGEEFVVALPETNLEEGREHAERLRVLVAGFSVSGCRQPITASLGVTQLAEGEDGAALLQRADSALYRAKDGGRNRVETDPPAESAGT